MHAGSSPTRQRSFEQHPDGGNIIRNSNRHTKKPPMLIKDRGLFLFRIPKSVRLKSSSSSQKGAKASCFNSVFGSIKIPARGEMFAAKSRVGFDHAAMIIIAHRPPKTAAVRYDICSNESKDLCRKGIDPLIYSGLKVALSQALAALAALRR